jgi:hypothetical protein
MELAIGVGESDPVVSSGLEAGPQRRAVAAVMIVLEKASPASGRLPHDFGRIVGAAVVDDNDFISVR